MSTQDSHITAAEVRKVAHLARLRFDEAEIQGHVQNLSNILDMIAEISAKDTSNLLPMSSPFQDAVSPLRKDEVTEHPDRSLLQDLAAQVAEGLYVVPKVIE